MSDSERQIGRDDIPIDYIRLVKRYHPAFDRLLKTDLTVHPFDLEDALDDPHMGPKVARYGYPITGRRPDFGPLQIRDAEELKAGMPIWVCHIDGRRILTKLTGAPQQDEKGGWLANTEEFQYSQYTTTDRVFLGDKGVLPLGPDENLWSAWNWLERYEPVDFLTYTYYPKSTKEEERIPVTAPVKNNVPFEALLAGLGEVEKENQGRVKPIMTYSCHKHLDNPKLVAAWLRVPLVFVTDGNIYGLTENDELIILEDASYIYWQAEFPWHDHFIQTGLRVKEVREAAAAAGATSLTFKAEPWESR